jgi:hypothetical protein
MAPVLVAAPLLVTPLGAQERSGGAAFGIEAAGGTLGSGVGVGLGLLISDPADCDAEDVACILEGLGVTGLVAAAAAPVGSVLLGRANDTEPSLLGAAIGSVAGIAVGLGVIKLLDEGGATLNGLGAGVVFTVSHGVVTALGSRLVAALR